MVRKKKDRQKESLSVRRKDRQKEILTVRRIDIPTKRQTDRTTDRRTDRHVNKELREITEGESLPPSIQS